MIGQKNAYEIIPAAEGVKLEVEKTFLLSWFDHSLGKLLMAERGISFLDGFIKR